MYAHEAHSQRCHGSCLEASARVFVADMSATAWLLNLNGLNSLFAGHCTMLPGFLRYLLSGPGLSPRALFG